MPGEFWLDIRKNFMEGLSCIRMGCPGRLKNSLKLSQHAIIRAVLQPLIIHLPGSPLGPIHQFLIFLLLGSPELDAALQAIDKLGGPAETLCQNRFFETLVRQQKNKERSRINDQESSLLGLQLGQHSNSDQKEKQ
ncbi:hypothetical protein TURU_161588 [Turdus rufiventris]|nr:hypothetical protein TURU_161588 [Turdus rufiventris]